MSSVPRSFARLAAIVILATGSMLALTAEPVDVSRIVDKASAESILGEPVKVPTPRNRQGGDGYYSKCNYYGAKSGNALVLRVYQGGAGFEAQKELDAVKASTGQSKPVTGLGDKAESYSGPDSGLPARVAMLYVIKGNVLLTVGLSGLEDDAALEKAKTVAEKILAALAGST